MKYSKREKEFVEKIHLLSGGLPYNDCRKFLESVLTLILIDFQDNSSTYIPFLGEIDVSYAGEEITRKGKQAKVDIKVEPDEFFLRNVGQSVDGDETDIEKNLKKEIQKIFKEIQEG